MKTLALSLALLTAAPAFAGEAITVYRDPSCGCCSAWATYMEKKGFDVTIVNDTNVAARAMAAGVPEPGLSCHHAEVGGYGVHGHIPAEIVDRLLAERPAISGLVLPGMPQNSPGMSPDKVGTLKVYSYAPEGVAVYSNE
ncbi:DUF411 domain-containing protein [Tropicimonas isoalkanivorans]|uniref:Uncharacterized conserved protein n=1 Tax=Tropicimonas isoalkanivorans TaxID=441112 RepID=A0A1I1MNF4_9RHOB|nr:DUF411 domain-containing protein [Tropicimonas isoalkanivorans]SFC87017.1 Uncharacterized conserved protein [Tropicimonas isoalkanivorans]